MHFLGQSPVVWFLKVHSLKSQRIIVQGFHRVHFTKDLLTPSKTAVSKCSVILIPLFFAPLLSLFHSFHLRRMKAKGNSLDHPDIILHRKIFLRAQDKIPVAAVDQVVIRTDKPISSIKLQPSLPLLGIRRMRIQRLNIQGHAPSRGPCLQIRQNRRPVSFGPDFIIHRQVQDENHILILDRIRETAEIIAIIISQEMHITAPSPKTQQGHRKLLILWKSPLQKTLHP